MVDDTDAVKERGRQFRFDDPSLVDDDLYELSASLRKVCPVSKNDQDGGAYFVWKYDDVGQCLRDSRLTVEIKRYLNEPQFIPNRIDPPMHTLVRRELNPSFSLASVKVLEIGRAHV